MHIHAIGVRSVHLNQLFRVVNLLLKQHERSGLPDEVRTDFGGGKTRVFIEFWVVDWDVQRWTVVYNSGELCSRNKRLVVLDAEEIPLARLEFCD